MSRGLADFIGENIEPILQAWEDFARTIDPPALTMSDDELRDHARQMLLAFAADLRTPQSRQQSAAKSRGLSKDELGATAAEAHAEARLQSGYTVAQLVSEYRALRASVLTLWSSEASGERSTAMADMTRFNEAIDQALAESVARYQNIVKQSQNLFLAILAHDLRNPLGALVVGSSWLMQGSDIAPQHVLMATRMHSSARRMSRLVDDLIDFTRTHLGPGIPIDPKRGNFMAVCRQVVNELGTYYPERLVELQAPTEFHAIFDDGRVAQMLSNLIGNALQYSDDDGPVRVSVTNSDDAICIEVNNRGPIIPPDKLSSIFEPLVRGSTTDNRNGATRNSLGLGLFIAREIIHAHGGEVSVTSDAEDGTTFIVRMPRWPNGFESAGTGAG
jgi:signal transduction histidine kinase